MAGVPMQAMAPVGVFPQIASGSHWTTDCTDCCNPDCGFGCMHYCCAPCQFGQIAAALPAGSMLCAGNCCGAGTLYATLGSVVYAGAVVGSLFFGLGLALSAATGA